MPNKGFPINFQFIFIDFNVHYVFNVENKNQFVYNIKKKKTKKRIDQLELLVVSTFGFFLWISSETHRLG